jgi:outer membrane protease
MYFSWEGRDGYYQYTNGPGETGYDPPPWKPDTPKAPLYGTVIRYAQNWFSLGLGGAFGFSFSRRFDAEFALLLSPLVYAADRDEHLRKNEDFYDSFAEGFFFEGSGSLGFSFSRRTRLMLRLAYRSISGSRGDSYRYDAPSGILIDKYPYGAGAAVSFFSAGLMFEYGF